MNISHYIMLGALLLQLGVIIWIWRLYRGSRSSDDLRYTGPPRAIPKSKPRPRIDGMYYPIDYLDNICANCGGPLDSESVCQKCGDTVILGPPPDITD